MEYLQRFFYDLWNDFGGVYLLVKYSDRTRIGGRGFTDEEKLQGLVLVFNNKTNERLEWDDEGNLSCVLAFGPRREDVFIHQDDLVGVFSPEAAVQFLRSDISKEQSPAPTRDSEKGDSSQVVSLSKFKKQKENNG